MKRKLFFFSLIFTTLLTAGFGCNPSFTNQKAQEAMQPITLNYWRVYDGSDDFKDIIANYQKIHPFVKINYRELTYDEYQNALLNAFAEDKGPDIFSIHNTWVRKYKDLIKPLPETITMAYPVTQGTLKKVVVPVLKTTKSLLPQDVANNFVDAVYGDVVIPDSKTQKNLIYGLPLSIDTLVMYYNKDLFNNAGIAQPPAYWNDEFQQDVKKLTEQDTKGQIVQSGVSLGGTTNVERPEDVLSVLMMQDGAQMMDNTGAVVFDNIPNGFQEQNSSPGADALRFYTDFANPAKEVYSWNSTLDPSLQMFTEGKLAMTFGYSYDLPTIRSEAPKLNFGIANLPQIENNPQVNFANYWVETVSSKSQHANEAWDFVQFETSAEQAKLYLGKAKKPTALRSLIDWQSSDPDLGPFVSEVLTAKSWYHGNDPDAADKIMNDMIDQVNSGQGKIEDILRLSAMKVQQTVNESNY